MATRNPFLTDWLKHAYGMELGLVNELEKQAKDVRGNNELQNGISRHLNVTRHHVDLLKETLQRLGENPTAISAGRPIVNTNPQSEAGGTDIALRTGLIDYVTESYEVASYRALGALARHVGDDETYRVCEQILHDESDMMRSLDQIVPGLKTGEMRGGGDAHADTQSAERIARDSFEALNSHDLSRWEKYNSEDFRSEAPGSPGPMNGQQNRDYLQNFFTAFPDLRFTVLRTIAQGNDVSVAWSAVGTHTGQLRTPDGHTFPATNKRAESFGNTTFEISNGKIRRSYVYYDLGGVFQQLGLAPKP